MAWESKKALRAMVRPVRDDVAELLEAFPVVALLTGDAVYAQRPLAEVLIRYNGDDLLQIKGG
jgi:hypothetical protein